MTTKENDPQQKVLGIVVQYRKWLIAGTALVASYALLGFFLAPWLVKKTAVEAVRDNMGAELRLARVAINPFVLSLAIDGLEFDDPAGLPLARVEQVFVNFQLSSLFRWAVTFDELRVDAPELFISRDDAGELNLAFLAAEDPAKAGKETEAENSSLLPLLIFSFEINDSALNWSDRVPVDPVETRFGPVNVAIANLNTLPGGSGQQEVVITTETSGTLAWSGTLQLNPLQSIGHAFLKGSHFPLMSAYIRHEIGFDVVGGTADVELDYRVATRPDGAFEASIDNFELQFQNVLVRTFSVASGVDGAEADRDVLRLPSTKLSGGTVRWPEQTVSAASLDVDDALVSLYRNETGELNVAQRQSSATESTAVPRRDEPENVASTDDDSAWKASLGRLTVNRMAVALEDHSVVPFANIGIKSLDLNITDISNDSGGSFPTQLRLLAETGGTLALDGTVALLPDPLVDLNATIDRIALAAAQPYIRPLADLNLDSGFLNLSGRLQSSPLDPLQLSGDLSVAEFLITETDEGTRLGSWERFDVNQFAFSSAGKSLNISEMQLHQPYGDIRISEDGRVNLGRVTRGDETDGAETLEEQPVDNESKPGNADAASPLVVTIGKVGIIDAAMDFADLSLPLPFAAKISALNGDLTTIATNSSEPSTVTLEGKVDEFGFVRVSGFVTPLDATRNTDLKVAFQNVEMPKLSAYTIPFAGREISNGRLDLSLGYKVTDSKLVGENKVVLRDLELGDKVEHPGAMSLPLSLAVALLKGPDGKIDIDLPVRGDVDDPEFRYGGVVLKALGNLVLKIVASPFALLGNLLGVEASELEYLTFQPGRADLTPPEIERAGKLSEALALRPGLVLELRGVTDREADGSALKSAKLEALIQTRLADSASGDVDPATVAKRQTAILEEVFAQTTSTGDTATSSLDALRLKFTKEPTETEAGQFDAVAYSAELRRQASEMQPLTDAELAVLANERAANTRDAVLQASPDLETRINIGDPQAGDGDADGNVRMKVVLSTGAENNGVGNADG